MNLFLLIKYKVLKKRRYLEPMLQDLVASKTNFKAYKIKILEAEKHSSNNFNYFSFEYNNRHYELLKNKLIETK